METRELTTLEALAAEAAAFAKRITARADRATLVTLSGELGAGKTAFVQALAQALGVREQVVSPTFVIERTYTPAADSGFTLLVHIDAYRLAGMAELAALNFAQRLNTPGALICLEWPERVADALPKADYVLVLADCGEGKHTVTYGIA